MKQNESVIPPGAVVDTSMIADAKIVGTENDSRLTKTGTILMHHGQIHVAGFEGENCGCREIAFHALLWGIGELQRELRDLVHKPGGSGNVGIDLPLAVEDALGLKDRSWLED